MNVTSAGKILVFVNLTLSLLFAAWAVGIATNRIDWPGGGATVSGEKAKGEMGKRRDDVAKYEKDASLALANWQTHNRTLVANLVQRTQAQAWFEQKLKHTNEGQGPILALVYQNNKLQFADGPPIPNLKSHKAFQAELLALEAQ